MIDPSFHRSIECLALGLTAFHLASLSCSQAVYANGERFEGNWVHGKRHGQGTYTYADGSVYTGEWDNDRIHGKGKSSRVKSSLSEGSSPAASRSPASRRNGGIPPLTHDSNHSFIHSIHQPIRRVQVREREPVRGGVGERGDLGQGHAAHRQRGQVHGRVEGRQDARCVRPVQQTQMVVLRLSLTPALCWPGLCRPHTSIRTHPSLAFIPPPVNGME